MTFDNCIAGCDIIADCQSVVYSPFHHECDIFTCRAPIEYLTAETPCAVRQEHLDPMSMGTLWCPDSAFADMVPEANQQKWDRRDYYIVTLSYRGLMYRVYCNRRDCMMYCSDTYCPGLVDKEIMENGMAALCKFDEYARRGFFDEELPCAKDIDGPKTNLRRLRHPVYQYVKINQAGGSGAPDLQEMVPRIMVGVFLYGLLGLLV
jgi:hypothetical protein